MDAGWESLEARIGYEFRDRALLRRALTHSSLAYESSLAGETGAGDNERLEFLGDAVLGFLVSEALVAQLPEQSEGNLSRVKAHLVGARHLCEVARELALGELLLLGRGEELSGGREKKALLENAVEALLAAIYLDGGVEAARRFVSVFVIGDRDWAAAADGTARTVDFRAALLELARERKLGLPRYSLVAEQGPVHMRVFTMEVRLGKGEAAQADGASKKAAAQEASRELYQRLAAAPPQPTEG